MEQVLSGLATAGPAGLIAIWLIYEKQTTTKDLIQAIQNSTNIQMKSANNIMTLILDLLDELTPEEHAKHKERFRTKLREQIQRSDASDASEH